MLKVTCVCSGTMLYHMPLQMIWMFAGAVFSGKRFLASVWKHVTLQTIWVTASVVALLTGKEFVSSVRGLVILEMTSTIARIVALLTYEMPFPWTNGSALCILRFWGVVWVLLHCEQPKGCVNKRLLSWMGEQTFFEVISLCTWVAALCASTGFPSRVYEHVYPEWTRACVFSVWKHWWLSSRTGCSCGTSFNHAESCAFWDLLSSWKRDHTEDMSMVCLQFVFQFPWLVLWSGDAMVLLNQSGSTVEGWLKIAEAVSRV